MLSEVKLEQTLLKELQSDGTDSHGSGDCPRE